MNKEREGFFFQVETNNGLITLDFSTKKEIGNGGYGTVYQIQGSMDGKSCKFALKDYSKGNLSKHKANNAVNAHTALENAGCKILPTYQLLEEGGDQILMTLHDPDIFFIIDGKDTYKDLNLVESPEEEKTEKIENFDNFIESFFREPVLAGRSGCKFTQMDIFHFTIDKKDKSKADFWLDDLDLVERPSRTYADNEKLGIIKKNLYICKEIMHTFLKKEIKGDMKKVYLSATTEKYNILCNQNENVLLFE